MNNDKVSLLNALRVNSAATLDEWVAEVGATDPQERSALRDEAASVVRHLTDALAAGADPSRFDSPPWAALRETLAQLSRARAAQGRSPSDTSSFVLALKKPLFGVMQKTVGSDAVALSDALWSVSTTVDRLAQHTVATFQQTREDIIRRQQEELLELSTPVVKLWEGVLAVPMIGVLDSSRTQVVMEALLTQIMNTGSGLAIIDITGVPTVDTMVAQHLLKTVSAIRLMGAECIISGIRPQIAQTIVHLGIDLTGVTTKATLADALALALRQTGWRISRDQ